MNQVKGIQIRELAIYHPDLVRDNKYFETVFPGKEFMIELIAVDNLGRDKRYVIPPESNENSYTIAREACFRVLEKANLTGEDIDLICFHSFSPEYTTPPVSLLIHSDIKGKKDAFCYDINVNCAGMLFGLEQLSKYMSASSGCNRALLVAAESMTKIFDPDDLFSQVCYGDCGCAMIIEKTDDESKFVDTRFYADSSQIAHTRSPLCGLSNIFTAEQKERYFWFETPIITAEESAEMVQEMLKEHNLTVGDIKVFCTSQFAKPLIDDFYNCLDASEEQRTYVGDEFGYTGASSPFVCMHELLKNGRIERGDYILLWTVGACMQYIATLIRY